MRCGIGVIGACMVLASHGFAQDVDRHAVESEMNLSGTVSDWPESLGSPTKSAVTQLQPSVTLEKSRIVPRGRVAVASVENAATAHGDTPDLRLEPTLLPAVPFSGLFAKPDLPGQALNLDGVARASYMQVRDGVVFLEGGVTGRPEASLPDFASRQVMPSGGVLSDGRED